MLSSSPLFTRVGAIGLALTWTLATFGAALSPVPAAAQTPSSNYYRAELVKPAKDGQTIAGSQVWNCNDTVCVADKGIDRPLRVCRDLFRKTGDIVSFTANGKELEAKDLARCNA
ncbi:MAG: hypothetical protein ABGW87_12895 [Sphingomonadaceae bacterium]